MQYSKCIKCVNNGHPCKMIMAQAITLLNNIEILVDYSQTRKIENKCILKIDYSCENFIPRGDNNAE